MDNKSEGWEETNVHVEVDDPDGEWTREGVFEVDPGVYRIPLPLPHDGLRAVNVYALAAADGLVLVDSGWGRDVDRDALVKAVAALEHDLADVHRILVTHVHRDHYGMSVALRREYSLTIALGLGERPAIELLNTPGHVPLTEHMTNLIRFGADDIVAWLRTRIGEPLHDPANWSPPDQWLIDDQEVALTDRTLRVIATPGHTQGHVVFVDEASGLLFAGDHVLPHITPSVGFEAIPAELALGDYLASLRLVREMPDRRMLPAHGPVKASVHDRVDELLDHHSRRLDESLAAVGTQTRTAFETANILSWTRRRKAFADLDQFNQMLAVAETAAHLDLLVAQGRLAAGDNDGVRRYRAP
jgi:glyoxylase-like metal-dependent hydrolase (beta-lactamase superfamily II)